MGSRRQVFVEAKNESNKFVVKKAQVFRSMNTTIKNSSFKSLLDHPLIPIF